MAYTILGNLQIIKFTTNSDSSTNISEYYFCLRSLRTFWVWNDPLDFAKHHNVLKLFSYFQSIILSVVATSATFFLEQKYWCLITTLAANRIPFAASGFPLVTSGISFSCSNDSKWPEMQKKIGKKIFAHFGYASSYIRCKKNFFYFSLLFKSFSIVWARKKIR